MTTTAPMGPTTPAPSAPATPAPGPAGTAVGSDAHGNPTAGGREAVARYDAALDRLLRYHPAVVDQTVGLVTEHPDFAMGQVLMAYLSLTSTDRRDVAGADEAAAVLHGLALPRREQAHLAVVDRWRGGDWHGAARALDDLLVAWPTDLLALLVGHQLDFFVGDAGNLRDRVGRSLGAVDPAHEHHGFVLGMQAFGLEEAGSYTEAEAAGLAALERNPDDVWAHHAMLHTFEMRGLVAEGITFAHQRAEHWTTDNLFTVHNWWHLALFLLEAGEVDRALAHYDAEVHHAGSAGVPLELLDASALLWRLRLDGHDTGGRFGVLAEAWAERAEEEPWYGFNDAHAVMALVGAGRLDQARAVVERLEAYVADAPPEWSNVAMSRAVALPVARALVAFGEDRHDVVVDTLLPIRTTVARFGGSHAQRDVVQRTLVVAALRAGRTDLARALVSERLAVRGTSVWGWQTQAQVLAARGDGPGADAAARRATEHRGVFAAAATAAAAAV